MVCEFDLHCKSKSRKLMVPIRLILNVVGLMVLELREREEREEGFSQCERRGFEILCSSALGTHRSRKNLRACPMVLFDIQFRKLLRRESK